MSRKSSVLLALVISALAGAADFESHAAHEHGVVVVNVVLNKQVLSVALEAPAMDVLGFEHAPRNTAEHAALTRAKEQLTNGKAMVILSAAAQCQLKTSTVVAPHDGEKPGKTHREHSHESEAKDKHEEGHSDFDATYEFQCTQPYALSQLELRFDSVLRAPTKLIVNVIDDKQQSQHTLNSARGVVRLRQ